MSQSRLLALVQEEIKRILQRGEGPVLFAFNPDPDNVPSEFCLAVEVDNDEERGIRTIVSLGDFALVPEVLDKLRAIHVFPGCLFGKAAPLLYALEEFSTDWALPLDENVTEDEA